MSTNSGNWISYAITFAILALLLAFRWKRMRRARPLKLERLWVLPALYVALCVMLYAQHPPQGAGWLFCLGALLLGALLGWQRGKMMRIAVDPDTHALNQTGSPAALLFIVALVVARSGARVAVERGGWGIDPFVFTDVLMALALGLFTAMRVEMFLRGRRLLAGG
ncbi:CcdC protein domain-containing protein [Sphingomonas sp. Mn802worker]|uniref:CcdC protein domain-containing protein n=1 Tax=Sphingomonas sp. Mn802worker TaxID=629773 RepID=UPI0003765B2F|nr:CcdC protein domain-containing protein [Sphingomonas sp. Mn802worker]